MVFAAGYLGIMCVTFAAAYVLPDVAELQPRLRQRRHRRNTNRGTVTATSVRSQTAIKVAGFAYLVGGLLFGIALYRARVLPRWAAALLAVAGVATAALVADARRLLPPAGLPQRHRHDRPGLLAVEGRPRPTPRPSRPQSTPRGASTAGVE